MMSDSTQGKLNDDHLPKTPEPIADENALFNNQVCPCEETEPEPTSEYEVPDEWVTYTGEVDKCIYEFAARNAESEAASIIRLCKEEDFNQIGLEHLRQNTSSDSSSDDRSSPPRVCNERQALMVLVKPVPTQTTDKAAPSAPSFIESPLTTPAFGEAAVNAPTVAAKQDTPVEIIDECAVFITADAENEREAAALFEEATNNVAGSMAEAAELSGHQDAAGSVRYDICAAQNAQTTLDAEADAKQVEQAFALDSIIDTVARDIVDEPPIDMKIDEWEVFLSAQEAKDAIARSKQTTSKAKEERKKAEAAEFSKHQDAARLAEESMRYDICAAQSAQLARDVEAWAAWVAQEFARTSDATAKEIEAILKTISLEKEE